MFTVCPKCALTLAVTATDLRVAQGYVRCGRCMNVFNALARLSEERPAAAPEPPQDASAATDQVAALEQSASPEPASPEDPPAPSSIDDDTGEIEIELDPTIVVTSTRAPTAPGGMTAREAFVLEPDTPAPLSGSTQPTPPDAASARALPPTPAPASAPASAPTAASAPVTTHVTESHTKPTSSTPPQESSDPALHEPATPPTSPTSAATEQPPAAQQTNTAPTGPEGAFELETPRPHTGLAWKIAAGVLVVALGLQVINHYRDALAANPALIGPLSTVYSALGVKLAPRWNIHAYDVHQLGASVAGTAAGEIVVRASVKNSASRAQPLPLLRVTLQDRFGNRIAARDVPPGDYLPSSVTRGSLLAAGGRVDATMVFVDPGPQAVGFEIDACLRQQSGEVACAHGP